MSVEDNPMVITEYVEYLQERGLVEEPYLGAIIILEGLKSSIIKIYRRRGTLKGLKGLNSRARSILEEILKKQAPTDQASDQTAYFEQDPARSHLIGRAVIQEDIDPTDQQLGDQDEDIGDGFEIE